MLVRSIYEGVILLNEDKKTYSEVTVFVENTSEKIPEFQRDLLASYRIMMNAARQNVIVLQMWSIESVEDGAMRMEYRGTELDRRVNSYIPKLVQLVEKKATGADFGPDKYDKDYAELLKSIFGVDEFQFWEVELDGPRITVTVKGKIPALYYKSTSPKFNKYYMDKKTCLCSNCKDVGVNTKYKYFDVGKCPECGTERQQLIPVIDPGHIDEGKRFNSVYWRVAEALQKEETEIANWIAIISVGVLPTVWTYFFLNNEVTKPFLLTMFYWIATALIVLSLLGGVAHHLVYRQALQFNPWYRLRSVENREWVLQKDFDRLYYIHIRDVWLSRVLWKAQATVFGTGLLLFVAMVIWLSKLNS